MNSSVLPQKSSRRSQRILLNVAILVQGYRADGKPFTEKTSTLVVNAHGALVRLNEPVTAGQNLSVTNTKANEKCDCRVVGVTAGQSGKPEVGLEFVQPAPRFWRVAFPPEDWSPHSPEAKRGGNHAHSQTPTTKAP